MRSVTIVCPEVGKFSEGYSYFGRSVWLAEFCNRVAGSARDTSSVVGDDQFVDGFLERATQNIEEFFSPNLSVYINQRVIENWENRVSLKDLFDHDPCICGDFSKRVSICPHEIFVTVLQNMKIGSQGKDSSECLPLLESSDEIPIHLQRIDQGFNLVEQTSKDLGEMISFFLRRFILVDNRSSFRAATSYHSRGLSYFRPRESWDVLVWAEELIHEATHNQFHTLLTFDKVVCGAGRTEFSFPAPLRSDLRNQFGNFQSLHVISRLISFYRLLNENREYGARSHARIAQLLKNSELPYANLKKCEDFTNVGREIFERELKPIYEDAF